MTKTIFCNSTAGQIQRCSKGSKYFVFESFAIGNLIRQNVCILWPQFITNGYVVLYSEGINRYGPGLLDRE